MLWLLSPPWGRWALALLIALGAVWVEFRPDPMVDHPFALETILPGEDVGPLNTKMKRVPSGLLDAPPAKGVAVRSIEPGEPIVPSAIGEAGGLTPRGWWSVEVDLPQDATEGMDAQIVLLDTGRVVAGVVSTAPSDDPLGDSRGAVAVSPEVAADIASAVANGRAVVMLATS